MDVSSLLALPSTLTLDRVERSAQGLLVYLHATTSCVSCPRCGTAGSRVHSRYCRTVADITCVGQRVNLTIQRETSVQFCGRFSLFFSSSPFFRGSSKAKARRFFTAGMRSLSPAELYRFRPWNEMIYM